ARCRARWPGCALTPSWGKIPAPYPRSAPISTSQAAIAAAPGGGEASGTIRGGGATTGYLTHGTIRYAGQAPGGGGSVRSTMMDVPLTITSVMRYGTSVFGDREVVTWTGDGTRRRTYAEAGRRAARLANALRGLG